ncbi:hypothetical protein [Falsirhodobacter halotolerans]|uniref:hypothetical protein n=1 Tax=Falsirhodobacter halotolerans TaxID=1146892 RepID=UPI001FD0A7E0|nr:hypothetical protein [Falsirhodobacter halotolerans]MCJ8140130.1 hypothetical protein [Falsirhodobacter halotolerans]
MSLPSHLFGPMPSDPAIPATRRSSSAIDPSRVSDLPILRRVIPPLWQAMAASKGFDIRARVQDRTRLLLDCRTCGGVMVTRVFTVVNAKPQCPHCLAARRSAQAEAAGVVFLAPHPERVGYGVFRAPCGHELHRQFELIDRVARGETGLRCGTCLADREAEDARRIGWERIGPDPSARGPAGYRRLYRHTCGHVQSILAANVAWGQCDCAGCGDTWTARPSRIYLFDLRIPAAPGRPSRHWMKLGYSAHPVKRHRHQLGLPPEAAVKILRVVEMPTGHAARRAEEAAHRRLRRAHPEAVVPRVEFGDAINVTREIYHPTILQRLEAEMDRIQRERDDEAAKAISVPASP